MAPIVAPGVARFVVHGLYGGRDVVNVLDMDIETTGSTIGRADALHAQAGIIINEWSDSVLPLLADNYTATSVSWVDLDSLNGSTGERTTTDQETWPQNGGNPAAAAPGNVAYRVLKNIVASRGQRQGRMYLAGVIEAATDDATPNSISAVQQADINSAFAAFLGDVNQEDDDIGDYTSRLVVVHTVNDVYVDHSEITAFTADPILGSQRRRLRG